MMRFIAGILLTVLFVFPFVTQAQIGPDCTVTMSALPADATGINVKFGTATGVYGAPVAITGTATTCGALGITTTGQYFLVASYTNPAGEGPNSTEVPFSLFVMPPVTAPSVTVQ